jgi:hypothetical protein
LFYEFKTPHTSEFRCYQGGYNKSGSSDQYLGGGNLPLDIATVENFSTKLMTLTESTQVFKLLWIGAGMIKVLQ